MRVRSTLIFALACFVICWEVEAKSRKANHYKSTASDDSQAIPPPESKASVSKSSSSSSKSASSKSAVDSPAKKNAKPEPVSQKSNNDVEFSIEDVDEDKIDQILRDTTKNLVVFFYDGRVKCPNCGDALSEVEEIDDDIEATGYIEVVKTDDRRVARENGVTTFPALVYFRRNNPILYDGEFKDSEIVWRWLRAHDEVVTWDLTDFNFESRTDSFSPDEGTLDWFVMFYDSEDIDCNAFVAVWETVAHKLRGLINVGKLDTSVNDDVSERFRIDDNQCPVFLLFHRGKMYRYNDPAKDVRGLSNFALNKFKSTTGHRVPQPPTALENFYEHAKEKVLDVVEDNHMLSMVCVSGMILIVTIALFCKAYRIRNAKPNVVNPADKKT